jgi:hypothetical protein
MYHFRNLGAAVAGLALTALLLAAPVRAAEADKLLPNDTETLFMLNVRQILDSHLMKTLGLEKLKEAIKSQDEVQKVLDDLGFDVFKDLDTITAANGAGGEQDRGLVIVHGKFDIAKFEAKAEEAAKENKGSLKIHKIPDSSTKLYEVSMPGGPGQPQTMFVALASKDTIVASPGKDYVLDALEKQAGKKTTTLKNKELAALLNLVDAKQSMWLAVLGSTLEKSPLGTDQKSKEIVGKIQDITAGVTVDKDIKLQVGITAKNANDAKELDKTIRDGLNQALVLAGLLGGGKKELEPLLDIVKTIRPTVKDKTVTIHAEVPGDIIEKAAGSLQ